MPEQIKEEMIVHIRAISKKNGTLCEKEGFRIYYFGSTSSKVNCKKCLKIYKQNPSQMLKGVTL